MSSTIIQQPEPPTDEHFITVNDNKVAGKLPSSDPCVNEVEVQGQQKGYAFTPLSASDTTTFAALPPYLTSIDKNEVFTTLTRLAAQSTASPIAFLSFLHEEDIFHKVKIGFIPELLEQESAFWSWAIEQPELFVIADANRHELFKNSPLVTQEPGIRFFAGAPLISAEGQNLGVLLVMDWRTKDLNLSQIETLTALAASVMAHLELERKSVECKRLLNDYAIVENLSGNPEVAVRQRLAHDNANLLQELVEQRVVEFKDHYDMLVEREEQYRLIINSSNDGLWDWDLRTNRMTFSRRWKALLGFREDAIGWRSDEWFRRIHPEDKQAVEADVMSHLMGLSPRFHSEHRILNALGEYRWVLCRGMAARNQNKEVYRFAGSMTDVTDQKEIEQQLFHDAFHDQLTGLPNRTLFMEKLQRLLDHPKQTEEWLFAVLFLDVDKFKMINDSLGHHMGDKLLVEMARRLEMSTRPGDMIARLGGDEFAIILERIKLVDDAVQAAERIQQELAVPFLLNGSEVFASASIGISHNLVPCRSAEDFIRNADTAMYRAKEQRRGSFELFDKGMHEQALARLQLENDLRHALLNEEFKVHYQPIVSLENWKIKGFEALIRWHHPEKGLISPRHFIPVAEETGLILQMGEWVLRQACEQTRVWQEQFKSIPPMFMSVNLSCKQFTDSHLVRKIKTILAETEVAAECLKIEITESAIMENIEAATLVLNQLKELGVKISLDDFGTGYSSLSYLHRFPIDTLKIDRSFVARMQADKADKNAEIIRTILSLATTLGMEVIAEGVETQEQIYTLSGLRCNYVQGYWLSKPLNGEAMTQLISETYVSGIGADL
jgi:diguanylate cyclase (GGDEF)-like protein/PAS domain S-box-containing protein